MTIPLLPNTVYHIYNHANGSENLFRTDGNYRYFLSKYAAYIYHIADTYAYCLMPNHFHLMVRMRSEKEVWEYAKSRAETQTLTGLRTQSEFELSAFSKFCSQQFSHLFNTYTQSYNKMYNRRGSLFERPFKRKPITDNSYFTQLIAYIHLNPVKHGFCNTLFDWPHSSIHAYLSGRPSKLNRTYLDDYFGNREALLQFHESLLIDDKLMRVICD